MWEHLLSTLFLAGQGFTAFGYDLRRDGNESPQSIWWSRPFANVNMLRLTVYRVLM